MPFQGHLQKYLIPHLEFQRPSLAICVTFLSILGFLHPLSNHRHLVSCQLHHFRSQKLPFSYFLLTNWGTTFPPIQCLIWSHTNSSLMAIIISKLHQWQENLPIPSKLQHTGPQEILKSLNGPFRLTIHLRMKCRAQIQLCPHCPLQARLQSQCEPWIPIRYN
jgi:hypothetical protein